MEAREPVIEGTFAVIRLMQEDDAAAVASWRNRPDVTRFLYQSEPLTEAGQRAWLRGAREQDMLFMFDTLEGEPVGTASVYGFQQRMGNAAEWGRLVAARVPGHPQALLEACYLVHRVCFEALGIRRMLTTMTGDNKKSNRINRFLGYVEEGLRRRHWQHPDGFFEDLIELGLFPEEFAEQQPLIEKTLYRGRPAPQISESEAERLRELLRRPGC